MSKLIVNLIKKLISRRLIHAFLEMHVYKRGQHIKDNNWPWPFKLAILAAKLIAEKTIQYSYLTLKELFTILKHISVIGRDYALNAKKIYI